MIHPLFLFVLVSLAPPGGSDHGQVAWHGDIPRAALTALPDSTPVEHEGAPFLLGRFATAEAWSRFEKDVLAAAASTPSWRTPDWPPAIDWDHQRILYIAFDGATRLLQPAGWSQVEGLGTLAIEQQFSRRRDAPEGPCSIVLQLVDVDVGRVEIRAQNAADDANLGHVDLP